MKKIICVCGRLHKVIPNVVVVKYVRCCCGEHLEY